MQLQISHLDRDSNLGGKILTQNSVILSENFFSSTSANAGTRMARRRDATGAAQAFLQISGFVASSGAVYLHQSNSPTYPLV